MVQISQLQREVEVHDWRGIHDSAQLGAQEATARRRGTATTATATAMGKMVKASPPTSMLPTAFSPVRRCVLPLSSSSLGFPIFGGGEIWFGSSALLCHCLPTLPPSPLSLSLPVRRRW